MEVLIIVSLPYAMFCYNTVSWKALASPMGMGQICPFSFVMNLTYPEFSHFALCFVFIVLSLHFYILKFSFYVLIKVVTYCCAHIDSSYFKIIYFIDTILEVTLTLLMHTPFNGIKVISIVYLLPREYLSFECHI